MVSTDPGAGCSASSTSTQRICSRHRRLFFHGSLVHGSRPNTTTDRFRRALIGHYLQAEARQVAGYYHPALRMDGTPLTLDMSEGGGACGEWTDDDGVPAIALTGTHTVSRRHE